MPDRKPVSLGKGTSVPKRLILCFDGMWDKPPDPGTPPQPSLDFDRCPTPLSRPDSLPATNVLKLYHSVLPYTHDGRLQQKWYDSGREAPWFRRFRDGAFGYGLDQTILQGYAYLIAAYEPGDDLFIYGFSRGAYVARSLVGLLSTAGLLSTTLLNPNSISRVRKTAMPGNSAAPSHDLAQGLTDMVLDPSNHSIDEAYRLYRNFHNDAHTSASTAFRRRATQHVTVTVLGILDTVGPLGVPTNALKWLNEHRYNFHDTELSPIVKQAYQALAIDEHRADHNATLWTSPPRSGQKIEQRWFTGAHGDVGGTYQDRDLADCVLAWMQQRSILEGLAVETSRILLKPNALGPLHDSFSECFGGFRKWFHSRFYRPVMQTGTDTEVLDDSVHTRLLHNLRYRPHNEGLKSVMRFG